MPHTGKPNTLMFAPANALVPLMPAPTLSFAKLPAEIENVPPMPLDDGVKGLIMIDPIARLTSVPILANAPAMPPDAATTKCLSRARPSRSEWDDPGQSRGRLETHR